MEKENDLVTVVIPVYNAGSYLSRALDSIVGQTYANLEIIIIDDGSTDGCMEAVSGVIAADPRIVALHQENSGKAAALNRALEIMKGEYWCIQDADDFSYPRRIERQLAYLLADESLAAVYVGHDLLLKDRQFGPTFSLKNKEECREGILSFVLPGHDATGLYRRTMVRDLRFDPLFRIGEGIDYVFQVGEKWPILLAPECLYTYRINEESTIRKNPKENNVMVEKVFRKTCIRRGLDPRIVEMRDDDEYKYEHRARHNHIIPHCMESVLDLRRAKQGIKALKVGLFCWSLRPFDFFYLKPLAYCFIPLRIIEVYRGRKKRKSWNWAPETVVVHSKD